MSKAIKHTFCRICEPACPLVADVEDGAITALRPDRDHPISKGFACHKGLTYLDVHNDPDRVNAPLKRTNPRSEPIGKFETVGWDEAFEDIGERLRAILAKHGPDAIATYFGNPISFNSKAFGPAATLGTRLGTTRCFNAGTQDLTNKPAAIEAVFGTLLMFPIPDFYNTNYLLCFGGNPKISHWTNTSTPRPLHVLQDIVARGGKVRFINPRRIESSGPTSGDVVQIKPDTDVYFLAALLNQIDADGGFREDLVEAHGKNIDGLRAFIASYTPEAVAGVTGVEAEEIRTIAREFAAADGASTYLATGVNQTRQGTLAYWLLNMLSFLTGNLGRVGGDYYGKGVSPSALPAAMSRTQTVRTPLGEMRLASDALPGYALADMINLPEEYNPVRALIVLSGNPLLSMPGEERMREAFPKLELVVTLDLYRNATGEYADYILPSADWLERDDINHAGNGYQPDPYVQFGERVVEPQHERRDDWWIVSRLEQELGLKSGLDREPPDPLFRVRRMLAASNLTVEKLKAAPHATALLPEADRTDFFDRAVLSGDKKVDCCPEVFAEAIERCDAIFEELKAEPEDQLKLISLRTNYMHNSNLANMKALKRPKHALNPLHIHPQDAADRNLEEGDVARIFNDFGSVTTAVTLDDTLRPGVVALSHGYGHQDAPAIRLANTWPGVNVNRLLPTGPGSYEPLSNMAHMNGVCVTVEAATRLAAE